MSEIVKDVEEAICQMDDILVHGVDQEEHDRRVRAALHSLQEAGITLNGEKSEFSKTLMRFLGSIIDKQGIHADPIKTKAISDFPPPQNVKDLQRFMSMVNHLGNSSLDWLKSVNPCVIFCVKTTPGYEEAPNGEL